MHCIETGTRSAIEGEEPSKKEITTWWTPIKQFLEIGEVPDGEVEATKTRHVAPNYLIINEMFYKNGYSTPYLRSVVSPDTEQILIELYEGYATCHEVD